MTNTVAYYDKELVTTVKCFIEKSHVVSVTVVLVLVLVVVSGL